MIVSNQNTEGLHEVLLQFLRLSEKSLSTTQIPARSESRSKPRSLTMALDSLIIHKVRRSETKGAAALAEFAKTRDWKVIEGMEVRINTKSRHLEPCARRRLVP